VHFDATKVRGEGNFVIHVFINCEIFPGQEDARICFTFLTTTRDFSEIQGSIILFICEILLFIFIFYFWELKSMRGI